MGKKLPRGGYFRVVVVVRETTSFSGQRLGGGEVHPAVCLPFSVPLVGYYVSVSTPGLHRGCALNTRGNGLQRIWPITGYDGKRRGGPAWTCSFFSKHSSLLRPLTIAEYRRILRPFSFSLLSRPTCFAFVQNGLSIPSNRCKIRV